MPRSSTIGPSERAEILNQVSTELAHEGEILFAYVYGSFLESASFHDIDVGVYLSSDKLKGATTTALELAQKLAARLQLPVDVRVLNDAPLTFLYHVLRGKLVLSRDDERLTDIMEETARRYLDIAPILRHYTKEAFAG